MRLIDADEFKRQIAGMAIVNNYPADKANRMCELIDNQPTAYDVDKVVERLKTKICDVEKVIVKQPADKLDKIANDTAEAFIKAYEDAIDIVKAGEVNE